jgi:hypothetical protein
MMEEHEKNTYLKVAYACKYGNADPLDMWNSPNSFINKFNEALATLLKQEKKQIEETKFNK